LFWTRLAQRWTLFVPTPRQVAIRYQVEIVFKDGTKTIWKRPYPPNWDFFPRHLAYNFQKWDLAANYLDNRSPLWQDLANYIQKIYWNDTNPPETITLVKASAKWPPPNESGYVGHADSELQWWSRNVFVYHVTEKRME